MILNVRCAKSFSCGFTPLQDDFRFMPSVGTWRQPRRGVKNSETRAGVISRWNKSERRDRRLNLMILDEQKSKISMWYDKSNAAMHDSSPLWSMSWQANYISNPEFSAFPLCVQKQRKEYQRSWDFRKQLESNWKATGKQEGSVMFRQSVLLSTALSARYEEYPPPEMPCQLGGPRFLMPPRVALAAWCLWKLGRTISSAMFTRQVSSAMAPLAFAAASWRMAMPNAVQLQTQALVEPRSLTCPSWKALGSIKQDRQAAFARNSPTSAHCYKNRYVYCCKYGAGVVECQPQHQSGRWCMDVFV